MENPNRVRGAILYMLKLHMERERVPDDDDTYMLEGNLQVHLSRFYRIHLTEGQLRAYLTTLRDRGYVKYKEVKTGIPPRQHKELFWRITGEGLLLLSGEREDPIVAVPKW
jgi:hypothetical protein